MQSSYKILKVLLIQGQKVRLIMFFFHPNCSINSNNLIIQNILLIQKLNLFYSSIVLIFP